jgi:hypothetical protein
VELLLANGADPFARTEGYLPFTLAKFSNENEICAILNGYMSGLSDKSDERRRKHMEGLEKSIEELQKTVDECETKTNGEK